MHLSCGGRSGGGRLSCPFPPPAQPEIEHPADFLCRPLEKINRLFAFSAFNLCLDEPIKGAWWWPQGAAGCDRGRDLYSHMLFASEMTAKLSQPMQYLSTQWELSAISNATLYGFKMSGNKQKHNIITSLLLNLIRNPAQAYTAFRAGAKHYSSPCVCYSNPEQSIYTQVNIKPSKTMGMTMKARWPLK